MHNDPASVARTIGGRVREARHIYGLRQDELALAAGVSTRLVHQIERGKPTTRLDGLVRVLAALGLTLEPAARPVRRVAPRPHDRSG